MEQIEGRSRRLVRAVGRTHRCEAGDRDAGLVDEQERRHAVHPQLLEGSATLNGLESHAHAELVRRGRIAAQLRCGDIEGRDLGTANSRRRRMPCGGDLHAPTAERAGDPLVARDTRGRLAQHARIRGRQGARGRARGRPAG